MKESGLEGSNQDHIPLPIFVRQAIRVLKIDSFQESEAFKIMKDLLAPVEDGTKARLTSLAVNKEQNDEIEEAVISLNRFNLLIELYHYYPIFRTKDRNVSTELYYIMSSNKKGAAYEGSLSRMLSKEPSK